MFRFDVLSGAAALVSQLQQWEPTRFLYFATPHIFRPRHMRFSRTLFEEFQSVYVAAFLELFYALVASGELSYLFYPSTVAIDDLPRDLFEYSVAKAAGEAACSYLQKVYPAIDMRVPRLPRVATDQTVNLFGVAADDPVPLILDNLR